ncbi:hypothetical protein HMSSN139_62100 [Paenibacillus sp. HMSSN-139]|nr:hypothetical protein HMSSN139_62100 [Paenibacillus sp. HMSSN-139]
MLVGSDAAESSIPKGWTRIESLMDGQPETFEAVKTHRDDLAVLAYTSGTTGNPKGVMHSHGWGYAHLRITRSWLDIRENDIVWATARRAGRSGSGARFCRFWAMA